METATAKDTVTFYFDLFYFLFPVCCCSVYRFYFSWIKEYLSPWFIYSKGCVAMFKGFHCTFSPPVPFTLCNSFSGSGINFLTCHKAYQPYLKSATYETNCLLCFFCNYIIRKNGDRAVKQVDRLGVLR